MHGLIPPVPKARVKSPIITKALGVNRQDREKERLWTQTSKNSGDATVHTIYM